VRERERERLKTFKPIALLTLHSSIRFYRKKKSLSFYSSTYNAFKHEILQYIHALKYSSARAHTHTSTHVHDSLLYIYVYI
jgi:hypothetical protein